MKLQYVYVFFADTGNKKLKIDSTNERSDIKLEYPKNKSGKKNVLVSSSETSKQSVNAGESSTHTGKMSEGLKETKESKVISDNDVSTSSVDSNPSLLDVEECGKQHDCKVDPKGSVSVETDSASEKREIDQASITQTLATDLKTVPKQSVLQNLSCTGKQNKAMSGIERSGRNNVSKHAEKTVKSTEMLKNDSGHFNSTRSDTSIQVVQTASTGMKSQVTNSKTDKKLSPPKSKSPVRSRSRSSSSKLPSDLSSPGSERSNSSRCSDRSLSPRNEQTFSAEMFSHFMNFCGVNPSDLPPVFQQNFARVPGAIPSVKSPTVKTGAPQVQNISKPERLKIPVLPPNPFGPFQANVLANLHKLSSPPNQQVFPPFNLPGLPGKVQGGYQHGASVNLKGSAQPATNVRPLTHNQGSRFPFGSMFSDVTLGGTHPHLPDFVWLSPDSKGKNKNRTIECEKIDDLFDNGVPPPNVDVSQLKDKGHGPIPKQKIASFLENPTEFLKQQTELVNNSISSTCSSPMLENKRSDNAEHGDGEKARSDSACSDRLNSPFKPEKEVSDKGIADAVKAGENVIDSSLVSSQNTEITQNTMIATTSGQSLTASSECCVSVASSGMIVAPVASAPPTPTTVVHHTPGSLSCHQMSLIKARQHALGLKEGRQEISKESLLHPLAAILNDPTIGQVFQQMFPEVVQEALMQSNEMAKTNLPVVGGQNQMLSTSSSTLGTPRLSSAPVIPNQLSTPLCIGPVPAQRPSFPIQELLSNLSQGEFPASTLLSAAAKAQFVQQQHHLSMLMAHHLGPLSTTIVPPRNQPISMSVGSQSAQISNNLQATSGLAVETNTLTQQSTPLVTKTSCSNVTTNAAIPTNTEKAKRSGAPKISELLNRNKQAGRSELEMFNLIQQLQKQGNAVHPNPAPVSEITKILHLGQAVPSQQPLHNITHQSTGINSSMIAPLNNVVPQGQNTAVVDQQLLQMYNALGFSIQTSMAQQKQQLSAPETGVEAVSSVPLLNQQHLINAHLQSSAQCTGNVSSSSSIVPSVLRQQDPLNSNMISNGPNFIPLLGNQPSAAQLINLQGIQPPSNISTLLQQQPTLSQSQPAVHNTTGQLPQIQSNQSVGVPNSAQDGNHDPLQINNLLAVNSNSQAVMNMLNIQQSIGNGTNLTAMQLQTLQLQQQLLQQLQQVQGMQNLISQYNLHNIAVNNSSTGERRQSGHVVPSSIASDVVTSEASRSSAANNSATALLPGVEVVVSSSEEVTNSNDRAEAKEELTLRKSNTIRVIAAADTTDDCSSTTRTVDIGTETDAIDEDNLELQSDDENEDDHDEEEPENTSLTDTESDDEDFANEGDATKQDLSGKAMPGTTVAISRASNLNTCLAIATQKGTTRSSELESRLQVEKSSLARSQNLSAELTKPSGSELKLKIKRKRLLECSVERVVDSAKKIKPKEKKEQILFYEKKELRSSTLAATKASSSLAAVASAGKDANRIKETQTDVRSEMECTQPDTDPKPSCSKGDVVGIKEIRKQQVSDEVLECDSSVDSENNVQGVRSTNTSNNPESSKKENLTSRIAAALSSQKGLWQLSCPKKILQQVSDSPVEIQTNCSESYNQCEEKGASQLQDNCNIVKEDDEGNFVRFFSF